MLSSTSHAWLSLSCLALSRAELSLMLSFLSCLALSLTLSPLSHAHLSLVLNSLSCLGSSLACLALSLMLSSLDRSYAWFSPSCLAFSHATFVSFLSCYLAVSHA